MDSDSTHSRAWTQTARTHAHGLRQHALTRMDQHHTQTTQVLDDMSRAKDLSPLVDAMHDDLRFCGMFAKLYASGVLVNGAALV